MANLPLIQQQLIRYGMTLYLALGLVGNICNCIMFTNHSYQRTPTSIYFLTFSIFAIIYLIWSLAPYIDSINHIDPQKLSLFYCKTRLYGAHTLGLYLRYIIVFASADRFFATQINVRIRSLSSISLAIKLIIIMFIVCPLIAIHMPILMTIQDGVCGMFGLYQLIYAIYQTIVIGTVPPILMSIFSILTIRTLYQRHRAQVHAIRRDRYLMRLVMAEVIANISISIPYSINLIYGAVTYYNVKNTQRRQIEAFITFITQFLLYIIGVVPFYLFLLTSKPFRNEFLTMLIKCWDKYILRRVRIVPLNVENNTTSNNR